MQIKIDESRCIGCGMCAAAVPEVFAIVGRVSTVVGPVLLFLRLRNEPCSGSHGIEILYKHLGLQTFAVLRIDRMFFEFPNNLFRKQFHNCFMQCLSSCAGVLQDGRSY